VEAEAVLVLQQMEIHIIQVGQQAAVLLELVAVLAVMVGLQIRLGAVV
jgi:uncharacterized membrane protein YphA (DoxX/SURF4 family)